MAGWDAPRVGRLENEIAAGLREMWAGRGWRDDDPDDLELAAAQFAVSVFERHFPRDVRMFNEWEGRVRPREGPLLGLHGEGESRELRR